MSLSPTGLARLTASMPSRSCGRRARVAALALLLGVSAAACEPAEDGRARAGQALVDEASAATTRADSAAMAAVRARYPRVRLRTSYPQPVPGTVDRAASFRYDTPGDADRYGAVIAVWTADTGRLVWTREHLGDFPPHHLVWLDADRDGRTDLFFTAGEENVLETYLFTRRAGEHVSVDSAFRQAYHNGGGYTTLLDLDGDGAPELIQPPDRTDEEFGEPHACQPPHPAAVQQGARQGYARLAGPFARLAGPFDPANVRWLGRDDFAVWTLYLHEPILILQLRDGVVRGVTRDFPQHLRWRIGLLEQHRAAAGDACRAQIDAVLRHLRDYGG